MRNKLTRFRLIKRSFVLFALGAAIIGVLLSTTLAKASSSQVDLIVKGGTIVTMDTQRHVIENGALAIKDGRIVQISPLSEVTAKYTARETVDGQGRIIIPGLINGHTHIPMTLFRGLADDLALDDWLNNYIFPAEARNVNEEFVRAGTQLGLAEMLRAGTTTFCDMYYFEDAVAEEAARAGVRAVVGETVIGFPVPDNKTPAAALAYAERFIRRWQNHPLITPAIAPHAPYTVSKQDLQAARQLSDRTGAPLLIHVAETRKELEDISQQKGASPVQYLEQIGFLNNRVVAAHVVYADTNDIALLQQREVGVVHNPQSNMKLASGVAPVPQMLTAGVRLGLGTDGAASNNDLNLWEEMDTAAKLHKVVNLDPTLVSAREAFEMATIRGAQALHMEGDIGSLEAGKLADFVLIDAHKLHLTPLYNVYSHLVYAAKAADVRTVVIGGRVVMRERQLLTLDEAAIKRRAVEFSESIRRSLDTPPQ